MFFRYAARSAAFIELIDLPSDTMSPASGIRFAIMSRNSDDFPDPDPPRMTSVSPLNTSSRIWFSTVFEPNRFTTSRT